MAINYFPIFKSIKKSEHKNVPTITIAEDKGPLKLHCIMCYAYAVDLDLSHETLNDENYFKQSSSLFENYTKLLSIQLTSEMQWNFRSEKLPFCQSCLVKVQRLRILQDKLEFTLKQIKKSVLDMKILVLKSQNSIKKKTPIISSNQNCKIRSPKYQSYKEKIDHFRSLAVKDLRPIVVVECRDLKNDLRKDHKEKKSDFSEMDMSESEANYSITRVKPNILTESLKEQLFDDEFLSAKSNITSENSISNSEAVVATEDNYSSTVATVVIRAKKRKTGRRICSRPRSISPETGAFLKGCVVFNDNSDKIKFAQIKKNFKKMENNIWKCKLCNRHFIARPGSLPKFRRHLEQVHEKIKPYHCRLCYCRFYERGDCIKHVLKCHRNELNNEASNFSSEKISKPQRAEEPKINEIKCEGQLDKGDPFGFAKGKERNKMTQLSMYKTFFQKKGHYYKCKLCSSRIMSSQSLKRHFVSFHGPLEKYKCSHCQKIFPSEKSLGIHLEVCHSDKDKETPNEIDDIIPNEKECLTTEKKIPLRESSRNVNNISDIKSGQKVHPNLRNGPQLPHIERGIICPAGVLSDMKEYFEDIAGMKVKARCKMCNMVISKNKRGYHSARFHNKFAGRFQCKYCKKIYYHKSDCAVHIRVMHYMEKPYQCSRCMATFTTRSGKRLHFKKCISVVDI